MKGIDASPAAVGAHARADAGLTRPAAQTIRFITAPGMTTDANPCHRNVSAASTTALRPGGGTVERGT